RLLSFVRGFSRYQSAIDPRTEIPPAALLPYRPQRARPYIYTDQEIKRLLAAARSLPPAGGHRSWKYYCLLGLLSVTGLRLGEALNLSVDAKGSCQISAATQALSGRMRLSLCVYVWHRQPSGQRRRAPHILPFIAASRVAGPSCEPRPAAARLPSSLRRSDLAELVPTTPRYRAAFA